MSFCAVNLKKKRSNFSRNNLWLVFHLTGTQPRLWYKLQLGGIEINIRPLESNTGLMHEAAGVAGSTPVGGFHCSAAASLTDVRYHLWDQTRQKFIKEPKKKKKTNVGEQSTYLLPGSPLSVCLCSPSFSSLYYSNLSHLASASGLSAACCVDASSTGAPTNQLGAWRMNDVFVRETYGVFSPVPPPPTPGAVDRAAA